MIDPAVPVESAADGEISQLRRLNSLLQEQIALIKAESADLELDLQMYKSKFERCNNQLVREKLRLMNRSNELNECRLTSEVLKADLKKLKNKPSKFRTFRKWMSKKFSRSSGSSQAHNDNAVNLQADNIRVSSMIPTMSPIETWV